MSRILKAAQAGSAACAVVMFISPAAFAGQSNAHVPTPQIHVPAPQVHVPTPQIHTPEARTRLPQIEGTEGNAPRVVGHAKPVTGQGSNNNSANQSIPGVNDPYAGASHLNTPGTTNSSQRATQEIPGIGKSTGGASSLNSPGSQTIDHSHDADKSISTITAQESDLLNLATKGGVNSLNTPTSVGANVSSTDNTNSGKTGSQPGGIVNLGSTGQGKTGSNDAQRVGTGSTFAWPGRDGSTNVSTFSQFNASGAPQQVTTTSTSKDGKTVTTSITTLTPTGPSTVSSTSSGTSSPTTSSSTTSNGTPKTTPSEDDSGSVSPGTQLSPDSAIAKKNEGGGTDNNSESSSSQPSVLAPGSSYARKGYGDGGGNDAGDNNQIGKSGTLATGSALTHKDYGDGGNSDGRGDMGASTTLGGMKGNPGSGGDPHQSTLSGAAAKGQ